MPGTKEGGKKAAQKTKEKYGSDFFSVIGRKGGTKPTDKPKGFAAATPEQRREWGRKGGALGRKGKKDEKN